MTPSDDTLTFVNDPSAPQALPPHERIAAVTAEQEVGECGLQLSKTDFKEQKRLQLYNNGYRKIIRNFTPS